jgi:crotonobetainyl-CoA:carnitine CoA-transferase CaiB-like acyl-CoA transferase
MSPHAVLPAAGDDAWCAVVARDDREWRALCEVLGLPGLPRDTRFGTLADRKRNEDELERLLSAVTATRPAAELARALQEQGVPASEVRTSGQLIDDGHLVARGFWRRFDHPVMGSIVVNRIPFISNLDDAGPLRAAPLLGEHTREIAQSLLGMSEAEYADHVAREVFV